MAELDIGPDRGLQEKPYVITRARLQFSGIVQGVGFRPFVYRCAVECGLAGFVRNALEGVTVEVEGPSASIERFVALVKGKTPPVAEVYDLAMEEIPALGGHGFRIVESSVTGVPGVMISPDIATCDECLAELFDPADRRYRYPFINCTNCGPRLTIVRDIPYDRQRTSMAVFPLCGRCLQEYGDPADRRFHAEPNACPVCGPSLKLLDRKGRPVGTSDAVRDAVRRIRAGKILAVKGIGGFHLCADACSDMAVQRLRKRKFREEKPLAVMVRDAAAAAELAKISEAEQRLLESPSRPIVLCEARLPSKVSSMVAPGMGTLGIMLPYTPLHHLLLERDFTALVMTSANQTDEPICIDDSEAVRRLAGIADAFLVHDREILVRCDDSVAMVTRGGPYLLRRSRGYAPRPVLLREPLPDVLALGPHLKATVCLIRGSSAFLSPHIGDLETPLAREFFHENVRLMERIAQCRPGIVACDMHPRYYSTRVASGLDQADMVQVQHHHAHIVSCMAENRTGGRVLGLSMDGTGYGEDGRIWGGEFLLTDETSFERAGHLKYIRLPGGETAVRQPWRTGVSLLREAYGGKWPDVAARLGIVPGDIPCGQLDMIMEAGMNSPLCSSLGRVFDGVASILDLKRFVSFEGQAAVMLEAAARPCRGEPFAYELADGQDGLVLDLAPAVRAMVEGKLAGVDVERLAGSFHATLVVAFVDMAVKIRERSGIGRAALSGGCFQNRILLEGCVRGLEGAGFEVYTHRRVPANDGGIALGQAVVAGYRMKGRRG